MADRTLPDSPPLALLQQIDAWCDRFETAWRQGESPELANFLELSPAELRGRLLPELLAIELEYRRSETGQRLSARELAEIHPELAGAVSEEFCRLATLRGDPTQRDAHATLPLAAAADVAGLHIRCPHCQYAVELLEETKLDEVTCDACGSSFSLVGSEEPGEIAGLRRKVGRFELVERLGMGAFGAVWRARDAELDREVAIKIPRRGQLDPREAELFFREARAAAQLKHPHIVPVHEVGRDGETIFIVSDLIAGTSLAEWLKTRRPGPRKTAELLATIADALHFAHEHGIVHRDLKPSNLMIDEEGQPHLMDFGLAKRDVGEITMTVEGQVLGTPAYMSPEQAGGELRWVDRRTDLYSLGVMLFQMLTGELPFRGSAQRQIQQRREDDPPSPRSLNGRTPLDLATICLKCLERDPNRRYNTGAEVAAELRRYLRGEPIHARPLSQATRFARWARRRPTSAAALGLTAVLAVAGPAAAVLIDGQRRELAKQNAEYTELIRASERKLDERDALLANLRAELAGLKGERPGVERVIPDWKVGMISDFLAAQEHSLTAATGADAPWARLALAYLQLAADRPEDARQNLEEAEKLASNFSVNGVTALLEAQAETDGKFSTVLFNLKRQAAEQHPRDPRAQIELFAVLLDRPTTEFDSPLEKQRALAHLREQIKPLWPQDAQAAYVLACYLTHRAVVQEENSKP